MCRFVAYLGKAKIPMQNLLQDPQNSLVSQSHAAKEGTHGINADGFGLAWYNFEVSQEPGIFKSVQPAWNDSNLKHLAGKIRSKCFLAHIRASTVGDVTFNNCHPFSYKQYSFAHNGTIRNFTAIRKALINKLNDDLLAHVKAQTDSEHLFFLIMQFLHENPSGGLEQAVKSTFAWVVNEQKNKGEKHFAKLNIVITNGEQMIVTCFASKGKKALSLNYAISSAGEVLSKEAESMNDNEKQAFVVASEPLTDCVSTWVTVPENSYVVINSKDLKFEIKKF